MLERPAKLLYDNLNDTIIERPNLSELNRVSDNRKQLYIKSNSDNMFSIVFDNYEFTVSPQDAFKGLAKAIRSFSDRVRFNLMFLPINGIEYCRLDVCNTVIRVIEFYDIQSDLILIRYDVLIENVGINSNA